MNQNVDEDTAKTVLGAVMVLYLLILIGLEVAVFFSGRSFGDSVSLGGYIFAGWAAIPGCALLIALVK